MRPLTINVWRTRFDLAWSPTPTNPLTDTRAEAIPGIEMKELSMGMSHDYELAARHGATMVRIGSALMGARDYGPQGQH